MSFHITKRGLKMKIEVRKNEEMSGVEIKFDEKPDEEVRGALKEVGFRWHRWKSIWYAKETAERLQVAENIAHIYNS